MTISNIAGAKVRIVNKKIICKVTATSFGFLAVSTPKRNVGKGILSAAQT
ncbi:hypothetical protein OWK30_07150 [Deferribacter abyssi]